MIFRWKKSKTSVNGAARRRVILSSVIRRVLMQRPVRLDKASAMAVGMAMAEAHLAADL